MTSRWSSFVLGAWRQLPIETVIVAAAAAGAIGLVHHSPELWCLRLLLTGLVATPLAFAAHRLERFGRRVPVIAGGLAAAGVFAAVSATLSHDALDRATFTWPYLLSLIAALLVPFVVPGPPFARFVRRFFEQTTTWAILCLCGLAAVWVVKIALTELFDLPLERLGIDAVIAVGCGFILIYLHRLRVDEPGGRMPELWRRLATMIGAPFVATMLVILVAYEVLARARGELPRNMLSPLIMAAGFVGFLTTLIIASVLGEGSGTAVLTPADPHRWARRWSVRLTRAFPVILLALLPMAGWALWNRVDQHGITPFRAVRGTGLVCLASLAGVGTVRWLRGRAALSWELPAAVIAFALIAAFGPVSAVRLSLDSQARRATTLLDEAGAGRSVADAPQPVRISLDPARYGELTSALQELARLGGEDAVRRVLSGATNACSWSWAIDECLHRLGVYPRGVTPPVGLTTTTYRAHGRFSTGAGDIERIDLVRYADALAAEATPAAGGNAPGDGFWLGPDRVELRAGGAVVAWGSIATLITHPDATGALPVQTRPLVRADGTTIAELAIEELELRQVDQNAPELVRISGVVVWRPQLAPSPPSPPSGP
jgi:hypothetical protein